jgi:hypothetical protein
MSFSPLAMSGRYFCFCSSVPARMIGKEPSAFTAYMPRRCRRRPCESSSTTTQRFEHAGALAAVLLGDPDSQQARLGESLLHFPGILLQLVVLGRQGAHHLLGDLVGLVPPGQGLGAEQLVQRSSPSGWVAGQNIREPDIIAAPRSPPRYPAAADSAVSGCREGAFSIR